MPELPEVETLRRQLKKTILHAELEDLVLMDARLDIAARPAGRRIRSVNRRGKFLDLVLDDGRMLTVHLRMSGRLLWQRHHDEMPAHTRLQIRFAQGRIVCIDPRRFATVALLERTSWVAPVADPLRSFTASSLMRAARRRTLPVKSFLLDQRTIAGIGNIYACEMLHRAAVHPQRRTILLSPAEWSRVAEAGADILRKATDCRGTSISDWHDLYGEKGEYQHHLAVYGRAGKACPRCRDTVRRSVIGGRGTYFCPNCQT